MRRTLLLLLIAFAAWGQSIPGSYIVEFEGEPAIETAIRARKRVADMDRELTAKRTEVRAKAGSMRRNIEGRGGRIERSFDTLLSGAAVTGLSEAQAQALRNTPGVKRVVEDRLVRTFLDRAVKIHKVDEAWNALPAGPDSAGQGIRIGIIDTGIDVNHPAFKDPGLPSIDGFPKVTAERDRKSASNKLIVLRSYPSSQGVAEVEVHGTSVAMTAAGGRVDSPLGPLSGIAPRAYIGMYNVESPSGIANSAILSALEDAVADGMDVINLSIGGPQLGFGDSFTDAMARVPRAGVILVVAAGNQGNGAHTVSWEGDVPGVLAVGATENDRTIVRGLISVDGGARIVAVPGDTSTGKPSVTGPMRDALKLDNELGCNSYPADALKDAIALIKRGDCTFEVKANNAAAAGAVAVVIFNQTQLAGSVGMQMGTATIPALWVNLDRGTELRAILEAEANKTVTIDASGLVPLFQSPDRVVSFSSRGPVGSGAIKPDLVATGADLASAIPVGLGPESADGWVHLGDGFGLWDGTSFSSPMVAGAAAVLKQARPGLTAVQYQSLLVNSTRKVVEADGRVGGVNEQGAGRLDLAAALRSPLAADPVSISFGGGAKTIDASRKLKFTNLSGSDDTFSVSFDRLSGKAEVSVSENSFSLAANESKEITMKMLGADLEAGSEQGWIVVKGTKGDAEVRVPYWYGVQGSETKGISLIYETFSARPGQTLRPAFAVRLVDASGQAFNGPVPEVTVESGRATIQSVDAIGDIPGTYSVRVFISTLASGVVTFRVKVGDVSTLTGLIVQ